MDCVLMNKNIPVVKLELDEDTATILKVKQIHELHFLPVGISISAGIPNRKDLNDWWLGRSIPASRKTDR